MPSDTWYDHDMNSLRSILTTCIGPKYGEHPEESLDRIRENRYRYGKSVCRTLDIQPTDTVIDIGSGCGFVTRAACEIAKKVHCLDISQDFLDFTRNELSAFDNTEFHKINYSSFDALDSQSIDKAFSTAVFIHFNYYDILFYLIEINRVLRPDALFYLEIIDADTLTLSTMAGIQNNIKKYSNKDRGDAQLMHPHSLTAFTHLANQLGFALQHATPITDTVQILLKKQSPPNLPSWLAQRLNTDSSATDAK